MAQFSRDFGHLQAICPFSRKREQRTCLRHMSRSAGDNFFNVKFPIFIGTGSPVLEWYGLSPLSFLIGFLPIRRKAASTRYSSSMRSVSALYSLFHSSFQINGFRPLARRSICPSTVIDGMSNRMF